jgi:putative restriction endonuclease
MDKMERRAWTRDELLLAINLYCKTPFGKIHIHNPAIVELAKLINRTPGSVSYKLANFASIDPSLDRIGASNVSKLDRQVWAEFFENWDLMMEASESKLQQIKMGNDDEIETEEAPDKEGLERQRLTKTRVNQSLFRQMVLSSYDNKCCITGLDIPELLIASHIIPWADDVRNRLNPRNGLCLNALHDRAFDAGLITLDKEFYVVASNKLERLRKTALNHALIQNYVGKKISLPSRFVPDQTFLEFHRQNIFHSQ